MAAQLLQTSMAILWYAGLDGHEVLGEADASALPVVVVVGEPFTQRRQLALVKEVVPSRYKYLL
jgi:hypothetical protein